MIRANYNPATGRVCGFNLQTAPYIEITEDERKQPLPDKYSYYAVEDGNFVIKRRTPTDEETQRDRIAALRSEAAAIEKWFKDNDYKAIKLFLGEWKKTDLKWIEYIADRESKRARLDELNSELNATNTTEPI